VTDDPALQRRVARAFDHFSLDMPLEVIIAQGRFPARPKWRLGVALALPLMVVVAIGLLLGRQLATPTSVFGSWQAVPSIADPKLAAVARDVCLGGGEGGAALLIQDQRGLAATLLFRNGDDMVMCVAYFDTNGEIEAATSSGTHLTPETTAFGLDSVGRAPGVSSANPGLTWLFGHQPADARGVTLVLDDGTDVTASSSGGWFLAWWPSDQTVASMSVLDAHGSRATVMAPEALLDLGPAPTDLPAASLPNPGGTCSASQIELGTATYSYGFGTLSSTVVFVTVPLRNAGPNCLLDLPATVGVAGASGPFHAVSATRTGTVTAWASESGQTLPLVLGASWWVGFRDANGNAVGSAPPCLDPILDVTRLELPFASGSAVIDLPTTWHEVCSFPASVSITLETK
jgi:hypothetical protein